MKRVHHIEEELWPGELSRKHGTRRLTFDSVTGRIVHQGQEESFIGRFETWDCRWDGDEWVPVTLIEGGM